MSYTERLRTLTTEIQTLSTKAKNLYAQLEAAGDQARTEDRETFNNLVEAGKKLRAEYDRLAELDQMDATFNRPANEPKAQSGRGGARQLTWGERVVRSEQFKNAAAAAPSIVSTGGSARMDRINVKAPLYGSSESTGGALIQPMRSPDLIDIPFRPRSVLDLINTETTTSNVVEYTLMATRTNSAAAVAEYTGGNFGLKPESGMTFSLESVNVRTIATHIPASRTILMDAMGLQSQVDNQLTQMVRVKTEDLVVNGDGLGENFLGILATPGILTRTQNAGARSKPTDGVADTIRRGLTDVRLEFYEPDGILLNPTDAEEIELQKGTDGQYAHIWDAATNRLWRVAVFESPVVAGNAGIVGAWQLGATIWDRMQTEIRVGEPNDYFLRNAVAILAELRAAFAVVRPAAFCALTFVDPS
jgi:HK97 family phage major capsid protein